MARLSKELVFRNDKRFMDTCKKMKRSVYGVCPVCSGEIYTNTKETINNVVSEYEVICNDCGIIGYWAYGSFDQQLPYHELPHPEGGE